MKVLTEKAIPILCIILFAAFLFLYALKAMPPKAYGIYCVESGELSAGENTDVHIAPASLTKLLTACTALYYIDPDEILTVSSEQDMVPEHSSLCLILEGHCLKLRDLIAGMLMVSGNDAAYTVAVSTVRMLAADPIGDRECVERFCDLMNAFADNIGMKDSHFATPDGSDTENQYTTVSDLIKLAEYALTVPVIREIVSEHQKYVVFESGENITWTNSNKLLDPDSPFYSEYAVGMKTGSTAKAGNCLIAAFEKEGKTYITAVAGCISDSGRYKVTLSLLRNVGNML